MVLKKPHIRFFRGLPVVYLTQIQRGKGIVCPDLAFAIRMINNWYTYK